MLSLPSNHQRQASVTFLRTQNIFLAEPSGSRYDYRTVHGSPILQAKVILLCFSLLQIFSISSTSTNVRSFIFLNLFSFNNANNEKKT
jgi:hypothetical protein